MRNMSNTITGRIAVLKPTQVVSDKFSKREFVIETSEQYPQLIPLEFQQDKCGILDGYKIGQEVEVGYNLRGRKWISPQGEEKYFLTLQAWSIKLAQGQSIPQPTQAQQAINEARANNAPVVDGNDPNSDLPF